MIRSPRSFRAVPALAAALFAVAGLLATNNVASASVVYANQAAVSWSAAPGSVVEYGVWVLPEGTATPSTPTSPTQRVTSTETSVNGQFGQGVQILVAAFYSSGQVGPFSTPSDTIYFRAPIPTPYDFNGDGRTDRTLVDNQTGRLRIQLVDGTTTVVDSELLADNPRRLRVSGSADFDGDGNADLVMWEPSTGAAELWLMDSDLVRAKLPIATLGAGWYARALGDIDADGTSRLFWHDSATGTAQLWSMRNAQVVAQLPLLDMPANWDATANCDVDGNGVRDIVWVDHGAKAARLWMLDAAGVVDEVDLYHPGNKWWLQACGDFDRDGTETLVWQRAQQLELWSFGQIDAASGSAIGQVRSMTTSRRAWVAQAADFDGDGDADMAIEPAKRNAVITQLREADSVMSEVRNPIADYGRWSIVSW